MTKDDVIGILLSMTSNDYIASTSINVYECYCVSHHLADPLQHGDAAAEELFQYALQSLLSKELTVLSVACEGESFRVRH